MKRLTWIIPIATWALAAHAGTEVPPPSTDTDDLYTVGQQLFDQYAPAEVKEQYAFPTKDAWDQFAARLQRALDGDSLNDLAAFEPEARAALAALRVVPGNEEYADWLSLRIDDIEVAKQALAQGRRPTLAPSQPHGLSSGIPNYDLWLARERDRPIPAGAASLIPLIREAFASEGIPSQLAWLAEVESNLNPSARSPAGARGLFQLMPDTAHALGLSTFLPDDRTAPEKSARAAAHYLHVLFAKFGDWPLALAAYNAGEGRVSRLLIAKAAADFAGISSSLPAETRMYVPKVCALVKIRSGSSL